MRVIRGIIGFTFAGLFLATFVAQAGAIDDRYMKVAQQATIRRDEWGVPHILAETDEAAAFAFGYAQIEDYPELLPRLYISSRGEAAKYFGDKEENNDLQIRTWRIYEDSVERFGELRPDIQAAYNAFAAGYNLYLERLPADRRKPWMINIDGPTVLAHGRNIFVLEFTMRIGRMFKADAPKDKETADAAGLDGRELASADPGAMGLPHSNMWGLGGARTESGRGILLANPHLSWSGIQTFYEAHIRVPGGIHVSGCTLIGSPGITIGFNENLGWSHTVNIFDSVDYFELTMDPSKPDHYLYDGLSIPLKKREVVIEVKAGDRVEERRHTVTESHFGPLEEKAGRQVAVRIPNAREIGMSEQYVRMGRAKNFAEFKAALDMQALPMFNICYSDREGNCYYIYNGRIPKRPAGFDFGGVVPGSTSAPDWSIIHPQADLPQLFNPPGSYVQNCNDAPWYTNLGSVIDKKSFPNYMARDGMSLRTQHSIKLIDATTKFTLEKVKEDKFTVRMLAADRFKDELVAILDAASGAGDSIKQASALLKGWNNIADHESRGSLLFRDWFADYTGKASPAYKKRWTAEDPLNTPSGLADAKVAVEAMERVTKKFVETFGRIDVAWGEVNRLKRGGKSFPLAGDGGQFGFFRVLTMAPSPKDKAAFTGERMATGGDSYVLAVEFTDPPTAYSITGYGQTEREDSPHHTDQSELFAAHKWKKAYFTEQDVQANARRTYHPGE